MLYIYTYTIIMLSKINQIFLCSFFSSKYDQVNIIIFKIYYIDMKNMISLWGITNKIHRLGFGQDENIKNYNDYKKRGKKRNKLLYIYFRVKNYYYINFKGYDAN